MEIEHRLDAVPNVLKKQPGAKQTYLVCDVEGFANVAEAHPYNSGSDSAWLGHMTKSETLHCVRNGNLAAVPKSDKILTKFEDQIFLSAGWKNVYDVVGAVPNVSAYIAGVPECMRRRQRTATEMAPLAIVCDLTSSAGIKASDMNARGVAILALVRLLANVRPIELYACIGLGRQGKAYDILIKIDTIPLDLARAAHILSHPSVTRGLGYGICMERYHSGGGWAYGDIDLQRATARESLLRILPVNDLLYMPPVFGTDKNLKNPVEWIKEMLAKYGQVSPTTE